MSAENAQPKRGGARPGAGRPKNKPEQPPKVSKDFATEILARIGKPGWRDIKPETAKDAVEYAISFLCCSDMRIEKEAFFNYLDRALGKPAQAVDVTGDVTFTLAARRERIRDLISRLAGKSQQ